MFKSVIFICYFLKHPKHRHVSAKIAFLHQSLAQFSEYS